MHHKRLMMRGEINAKFKVRFRLTTETSRLVSLAATPEPRLYPDCKQLTLQTAAATASQFSAVTSAFDDFSRPRYDKVWRISVTSPDCEFSLPDNYPLDKCPWHMVPGRGPVKIAAALAVAAAGLGGGLAYKKYKTYLHEKQLRKERKERRKRDCGRVRTGAESPCCS